MDSLYISLVVNRLALAFEINLNNYKDKSIMQVSKFIREFIFIFYNVCK